MEIIESYLSEVGRYLPEASRQEILRELRDDLLEALDAAAEQSPGPLTDAQQREVLRRFGHPFKMAAQYRPQRYLIGPELYPTFMQTLKTVFVLAILLWVGVTATAFVLSGEPVGPLQLLGRLVELCIWVLAVVVLVFIAIEYSGERLQWYENWDPARLSRGSLNVIRRGDVISNLITEGVFLLWWNDVLSFSRWLPTEGGFDLSLSATWDTFFWPLNIVFGLAFALHFYVLVRGVWQRGTLLCEVVVNVALLAVAFALLVNGPLLEVQSLPESRFDDLAQNVARSVLLVIGGFTVWDIWLAVRGFRGIQLLTH